MEETIEKTATQELDLSKFPHLAIVKESITTMERLIELLNEKREILVAKKDDTNSTREEKINAEIGVIDIDNRKSKVHTQLIQKKKYYEEFYEKCVSTLEEIATEWDDVMRRADVRKGVDKEFRNFIEQTDTSEFESNLEKKLHHFVTVKRYLTPKNKQKKK